MAEANDTMDIIVDQINEVQEMLEDATKQLKEIEYITDIKLVTSTTANCVTFLYFFAMMIRCILACMRETKEVSGQTVR